MSKQIISTVRTHLRWCAFSLALVLLVIVMPLALAQRQTSKNKVAANKSLLPASTTAVGARAFQVPPAPKAPQVVLYDQYNNAGTNATLSATFTDFPTFSSDLADDFIVPGGQTWTVQSIDADGVYFNGPGPAIDWNVFVYSDSGGLPGAQVYSTTHQPVTVVGTTFTVNLPIPPVLNPGHYWIEIQANMTFGTQGEWGWTDRTVTSNNDAAFQNPGGGFGICPTWSRRGATCAIDPTAPDQVYRLNGTLGASCTVGTWSAGGNFPSVGVRSVGVFFPANGKFYAMGGRSSDAAGNEFTNPFEYDTGTNTWTTKVATFPDAQVNNMACRVLTDAGTPYIYCVGGSQAGNATISARVFRYNPVTDAITTVAAPWPGAGTTVLPGGFSIFSNKLYILGGFDTVAGNATSQIWEFTPGTNVWVQKAAVLPVPRGYIPTTTIGSLIYTGGGAIITGGAITDGTDSFVYNPMADTISTIAPIPRATGETRALAFNGQMLVMGGGRTAPNPSNEVDAYDPGTNTWAVNNPVPAFMTARRNFATDTNGSTIWLAGGYAPTTPTNSTEVYCGGAAATLVSAVSRKMHGAAGNFDVTLLGGLCPTGIIQNGGFETGSFSPGWVIDGNNATPVVTNTQAHSGTYSGFVGDAPNGFCGFPGAETTGDSSFYQQFTVPAGGGTLSFWHQDCTTDTITFDWQDAYITDSNGTILQTIFHVCDTTAGFVNTTVNMTPYAGQTVRIKFLAHEDGFGDLTGMYVDDVVLLGACPPGIEDRTGGATNDYTMLVTFSGNVTVNGSPQAQVISGAGCVGSAGVCNGMVTVSGATVTIPLTNITDVQRIQVRLNGVNGAANFIIPMGVLIGDANATTAVNASDVALTKSQVGQNVGSGNFREDVNTSGTISSTDVAIVKSDVGHALPP